MTSKKKQQRKAQAASLKKSHWAYDAPDNPSDSVRKKVIIDHRETKSHPERRDKRLRPLTSITIDDMHKAQGPSISDG